MNRNLTETVDIAVNFIIKSYRDVWHEIQDIYGGPRSFAVQVGWIRQGVSR
jgi:hypothetical protein